MYFENGKYYENVTITIIDSIYYLVFYLKHNILETGFCPRIQAEPTEFKPLDRTSLCLCTLASQVKSSYITTNGQSASLSWCQAPLSDLGPIFLPFLNYS
jgi:hypothetical protein